MVWLWLPDALTVTLWVWTPEPAVFVTFDDGAGADAPPEPYIKVPFVVTNE